MDKAVSRITVLAWEPVVWVLVVFGDIECCLEVLEAGIQVLVNTLALFDSCSTKPSGSSAQMPAVLRANLVLTG
jgi:hypothetical protein